MRLLLFAALLAGCYASHSLGDGGPPSRDAAPTLRDAALHLDAPIELDAGVCGPSSVNVEVRIEPITLDRDRCTFGRVESATMYAIAPEEGGVRISMDLCPAADADCRCDFVVTNVGADIGSVLGPIDDVTIDVGPGHVSISTAPTCECLGCACSHSLVLYAASAPPDTAPALPRDLQFALGGEICPAPSACVTGTWRLRASNEEGAVEVAQGADSELGAIHVRGLRDVDVFGPCAACATCGSLRASWVAWVVR